jgi:hypothetical protein
MWGSFCDPALAVGPPHKGSLLAPASAGEIEAVPVHPGLDPDGEIVSSSVMLIHRLAMARRSSVLTGLVRSRDGVRARA